MTILGQPSLSRLGRGSSASKQQSDRIAGYTRSGSPITPAVFDHVDVDVPRTEPVRRLCWRTSLHPAEAFDRHWRVDFDPQFGR